MGLKVVDLFFCLRQPDIVHMQIADRVVGNDFFFFCRNKHSNVVIYRCEFCQKGFYRVLAYEKHRATHTGVAAAVPCSQSNCDFTYSDMTQLKVLASGKIFQSCPS